MQNTYQKDHKKLSLAMSPLKHYNIIKQVPLVSYTKKQSDGVCVNAQKSTQTPSVTVLSISNSLKRDKLTTCASSICWNKTEICSENSYQVFKSENILQLKVTACLYIFVISGIIAGYDFLSWKVMFYRCFIRRTEYYFAVIFFQVWGGHVNSTESAIILKLVLEKNL